MTAISDGQAAILTARCGVARCGIVRAGCAPNDVEDTASGVTGQIVHSDPTSMFATSTGTVLDWGLGGVDGGVDPLSGGL